MPAGESDAKSVNAKSVSNEYLFQISAEEEKNPSEKHWKYYRYIKIRFIKKVINVTSYVLRFVKNIVSSVRNEKVIKDTLSVEERDQAVELGMEYEQNCLRQQSNYQGTVMEII